MRDYLNHADNPTSYRCGQQGGRCNGREAFKEDGTVCLSKQLSAFTCDPATAGTSHMGITFYHLT